jgi:hypothetical protein
MKGLYIGIVDVAVFFFDITTSVQLLTMLRIVALTLSLSTSLVSCHPTAPAGPTVQVKNGTYVGLHSSEYNQDYFLGIKYAQPPVGDLRYRNPVALNQSWSDTKPATAYSAEVCIETCWHKSRC